MKYKTPIAIALIAGLLGFTGCASQPAPDGTVRNNVRNNVSRSVNDGKTNIDNRYSTNSSLTVPRYRAQHGNGIFSAVRNAANRPASETRVGKALSHTSDMYLIKDMDGAGTNRSSTNSNAVARNQTAPRVYGNKAVTRQAAPKAPTRTTPPQNVIRRDVQKIDGQHHEANPTTTRKTTGEAANTAAEKKHNTTSNVTRKTPVTQHNTTSKSSVKAPEKKHETTKPVTRKAPATQHSTTKSANTATKKHEAVNPTTNKEHSVTKATPHAAAAKKPETTNHTTVTRKSPIKKHIQVQTGNTVQNVPIRPDGTYTPFVGRTNPDGTINNRIMPRSDGTGEVVRAGYPINRLQQNAEMYNGHTVHYDADGYVLNRSNGQGFAANNGYGITRNRKNNVSRSTDGISTNRNARRAAQYPEGNAVHYNADGVGTKLTVNPRSLNRKAHRGTHINSADLYGMHNTGQTNPGFRRTNRPQNARYDHAVQRGTTRNNNVTNTGYYSAGFNVMNLPNWNII